MTIVISVYEVANFPEGGGHFWVYLQYALGLRRLGCEVYWLEQVRSARDAATRDGPLSIFRERMRRFGLEDRLLLYVLDRAGDGTSSPRFVGRTRSQAEAILRRADLLLNFHYAIDPRLLDCARRTALVDIDPGLLQFWIGSGQIAVAAHDRYLTTGETVGTPGTRVPDCGLHWLHVRPPVCLEFWPFVYHPRAHWVTTVSSWASHDWLKMTDGGTTIVRENTKRVAFLPFVELPLNTSQPLELALYLVDRDPTQAHRAQAAEDARERALLERNRWRVRDSREVAGSPEAYRSYIQRSRGEFSCAKPSCVDFQNAWVSDRTLCYLASGKPVVVQDTGPSSFLPHGEGMFRFTSLDQAVQSLEEVNARYALHCHAAREIAVAYFGSDRVLEGVLNAALGPAFRLPGVTAGTTRRAEFTPVRQRPPAGVDG